MRRPSSLALTLVAAAIAAGCDSSPGIVTGDAPPRDLPTSVLAFLPPGVEVAHQEGTTADPRYHLWILRASGDAMARLPDSLPELERHELPGLVLNNLLRAKAPGLASERLGNSPCRFAHWHDNEGEYRLRESTAGGEGWVASLEHFRE